MKKNKNWVFYNPIFCYNKTYMWLTLTIIFVLTIFLGEELMLFVGAMMHIGFIPFWQTLLTVLLAVYFGDFLFFYLGYRYGERLIERLIKWRLVKETKVEKIKGIFNRGGSWILFVSKFAYGLNHLTQMIAGSLKFEVKRYVRNQILASFVWTAFCLFIGYTFSAVLSDIFFDLKALTIALLLIFAAIFALGWLFDCLIIKIFPRS